MEPRTMKVRVVVVGLSICALVACGDDAECPEGTVDVDGRCVMPDAGQADGGDPDGGMSMPDSAVRDGALRDGGERDASLPPAACSEEDVAGWRSLHREVRLVDTLFQCGAEPECAGESCSFERCLRHRAGLEACETCVEREVDCVLTSCRDECGVGGSSAACRYCMCEAGCVGTFEACAEGELDVCAVCDDDAMACAPYDLSAAVIVSAVL